MIGDTNFGNNSTKAVATINLFLFWNHSSQESSRLSAFVD